MSIPDNGNNPTQLATGVVPADRIATTPPKRNRPWLLPVIVGASALLIGGIFGIGIGAAAGVAAGGVTVQAEPTPQPTVTVTEEVVKEVEVEVPGEPIQDGCRDVAIELWSMLETMNNDVVIPLANGGSEGISAILAGDDIAFEQALNSINGANSTIEQLTVRIETVGPAYQTCTG